MTLPLSWFDELTMTDYTCTMSNVYIALGSNIDAESNMQRCCVLLKEIWADAIFSSVYQSASLLKDDQEDYLNAVARFSTKQTPDEVQNALQGIEGALGKQLLFEWGPRTIDLDLLLYDELVLPDDMLWKTMSEMKKNDSLIVPHPRMHERNFVLQPLCELLDENAKHPALNTAWEDLLDAIEDQNMTKTDLTL